MQTFWMNNSNSSKKGVSKMILEVQLQESGFRTKSPEFKNGLQLHIPMWQYKNPMSFHAGIHVPSLILVIYCWTLGLVWIYLDSGALPNLFWEPVFHGGSFRI